MARPLTLPGSRTPHITYSASPYTYSNIYISVYLDNNFKFLSFYALLPLHL